MDFKIGDCVRIIEYRAFPELNGRTGVVTALPMTSRPAQHQVKVDAGLAPSQFDGGAFWVDAYALTEC